MVEGKALLRALVRSNRQRLGTQEGGFASNIGDGALLGELPEPAGQFLDYAVFPGAQLVDVNLRLRELDAPVGGLARLGQHPSGVQQRL